MSIQINDKLIFKRSNGKYFFKNNNYYFEKLISVYILGRNQMGTVFSIEGELTGVTWGNALGEQRGRLVHYNEIIHHQKYRKYQFLHWKKLFMMILFALFFSIIGINSVVIFS